MRKLRAKLAPFCLSPYANQVLLQSDPFLDFPNKVYSSFTQLGNLRYSCNKECPPRYECQQPEPSDSEQHVEYLKKEAVPFVFRTRHCKDPTVYKNIFFYICIPVILCLYINMTYINPEKPKRPKFVKFDYLRIRNKPFPWDPVRTLLHNPLRNALPDGYEEEVPEDEEYDPFEEERK